MKNSHPIRVLHIITRLIRGGADENTIYTVEGLDPQKFNVDIIVGGQSEQSQIDLLEISTCITYPSLVREISPIKDARTLIKLCKLIKKEKYHIVHTHTAKAGMLGRFAAKLCGVPVIIHTLHGSTFHPNLHTFINFIYRALERWAAQYTDKIISVGDDLTSRYLNAQVGHKQQYILIRSGFELARFHLSKNEIQARRRLVRDELNISDSDTVIGSIGRLEPRKGHVYLLDAVFDLLQKRNHLKVILAGEGSSSRKLQKLCKKMGIEDHVIFAGYREDVEDVISASDIIALTSLWEGLPRVMVQSASLGKPLISFETEGARELIKNELNGFVVPLKDVDQLSDKLFFLLKEPARAKKMGEEGRKFVTNDWDKNIMVQQIEAVYQKLLNCKL